MTRTMLSDTLISLERNVAALYLFYADLFPDDAPFWHRLHFEEENHALALAHDGCLNRYLAALPDTQREELLAMARAINARVREVAEEYQRRAPSRREAYLTALQLEQTAGEYHTTEACKGQRSGDVPVFERLGEDDADHAERIRQRLDAWRATESAC